MTKKVLFSEDIIEVARRFDQCGLPEIQAAFNAAAAAANDKGQKEVLRFFLGCAEKAKTSNDPESLGNLAAAFGAAGHPDIAIPMLEKACEVDTDAPVLNRLANRFNFGLAHENIGCFPEALAAYEQVFEVWENRLNTRDPRAFINSVIDDVMNSERYATILHESYESILFTAGTIGTELLAQGKAAEARPYLGKAAFYRAYLEDVPTEMPTDQGPTLH